VWDKRWVVITRLVKATTATVIVSQSSNSSLEFSASANLASAYPALGKADAGLTMKHQSGSTIKVIGEKRLTPLFQLGCLKTGLFGGSGKVQTRSLRSKDPSVAELTPSHVAANKAAADSLVFDTVRDDEVIHE
jgi:hypothetical protein